MSDINFIEVTDMTKEETSVFINNQIVANFLGLNGQYGITLPQLPMSYLERLYRACIGYKQACLETIWLNMPVDKRQNTKPSDYAYMVQVQIPEPTDENQSTWLHDLFYYIEQCDYQTAQRIPDNTNRPSLKGMLQGILLYMQVSDKTGLCDTCAYRMGTLGNTSMPTQTIVSTAYVWGLDFYCHKEHDFKGQIEHPCKCRGFERHKERYSSKTTIKPKK